MRPYLDTFNALLAEHVPLVAARLQEVNITAGMFLVEWLLTMYSKCMPLDMAMRVWDLFFLEGELFLFRTGMGILKMYGDVIVSQSFDETAHLLTHLPADLNEHVLFQSIASINPR